MEERTATRARPAARGRRPAGRKSPADLESHLASRFGWIAVNTPAPTAPAVSFNRKEKTQDHLRQSWGALTARSIPSQPPHPPRQSAKQKCAREPADGRCSPDLASAHRRHRPCPKAHGCVRSAQMRLQHRGGGARCARDERPDRHAPDATQAAKGVRHCYPAPREAECLGPPTQPRSRARRHRQDARFHPPQPKEQADLPDNDHAYRQSQRCAEERRQAWDRVEERT